MSHPPLAMTARVQLPPVNGDLERLIAAAHADQVTLGWMHQCRGPVLRRGGRERWLPLGEDCPVCLRGCP